MNSPSLSTYKNVAPVPTHHVAKGFDLVSQFSKNKSHFDRYTRAIKVQRDREERIERAAAATDLQVLGPVQIARIQKIKKEFPEFANV